MLQMSCPPWQSAAGLSGPPVRREMPLACDVHRCRISLAEHHGIPSATALGGVSGTNEATIGEDSTEFNKTPAQGIVDMRMYIA